MDFKIRVIDSQHIQIFGKTAKEAHMNAIDFWKLFIGDKWLSFNPSQLASFENEYGIYQREIYHKTLDIVIPE